MTHLAATTTWTDFAMRPNTTSTEGQVPVSGSIVVCPDIIPQTATVTDPQGTFATPASWQETYAAQVQEGMPNYIYVRAKNFYNGAESGTVRLYAVGCSLINWPSMWLDNPLPVQTGGNEVPLSAAENQQIAVGAQPFYWAAPPPPSGSDHYCLFALVDTPKTPNPLLHANVPNDYKDMADLVNNSLNVGWKNVAEVSTGAAWTHTQTLYIPPTASPNQQLHVYVFGTAGTVGGQVAFSVGDSRFSPPLELGQTTIRAAGETYGKITTPPAGLVQTVLNVSYWNGSSSPGFADRIVVGAGWVPPTTEDIGRFIEAGTARRLPRELAASPSGDFLWEVPIGAMTYQFSAR